MATLVALEYWDSTCWECFFFSTIVFGQSFNLINWMCAVTKQEIYTELHGSRYIRGQDVVLQGPLMLRLSGTSESLAYILQDLSTKQPIWLPKQVHLEVAASGHWVLQLYDEAQQPILLANASLCLRAPWHHRRTQLTSGKWIGHVQQTSLQWAWMQSISGRLIRVRIGEKIGREAGCIIAMGERYVLWFDDACTMTPRKHCAAYIRGDVIA